MKELIEKFGGDDFANPASVRPTSEATRHDIVVRYADNRIMGCDVHLRSYNGKVVGETIRGRPGDTLHLRVINELPPVAPGVHKHPQDPVPPGHADHFSFNVTNLHTHGLHVAPQGPDDGSGKVPFESDNVLIELQPGEQQTYRIQIGEKHAAGTFWYHAHVHGSTAVQLASGMAGALIIEDGKAENGDLGVLPEIPAASEKIFVLQQFGYDNTGKLEALALRRQPTLVNGQLVPTIRMRPGEVQRWRFIHAGIQENIALALDGHPLHEVAADGISLGRSVQWPDAATADSGPIESKLVLSPGYRTDVLVKAELEPGQTSRRIFLRDLKLPNSMSLLAAQARNLRALDGMASIAIGIPIDVEDKPEQVLAVVVIEGSPVTMELPTVAALANIKPVELEPITTAMLQASEAQSAQLELAKQLICPADGACRPCTAGDPDSECNRKQRYLINGRQFSETNVRTLRLNTAAEWTLTGMGVGGTPERHPFHIHVNPFYYQRTEPGGGKSWIWKDTLLVPVPGSTGPEKIRMRYTEFTGKFVIHCHILIHEDQGMMQLVEIVR
jgi:FtsP/CotA-like multicopper oxidase with cupredoxin domain